MIYFLTKRAHQLTWRRSMEAAYGYEPAIRRELFERIVLLSYEELFKLRELAFGTYVFADLDRLSVQETEQAATYWHSLASAGPHIRLVNNPITSMRRFELLRYLYTQGVNRFNVQRLTEPFLLERFPVFIRAESGFAESAMPLLNSREELEKATREIIEAGESRDDKIVIEYVDARETDGSFHRFSALVADSRVIKQFKYNSTDWFVKVLGKPLEEQDLQVQDTRNHDAELLRIFRLANIDYGRADYAVIDGRIQIFEINTNPTIGLVEILLAVARALDIPSPPGCVSVVRQYKFPREERMKVSRSFRIARTIHISLRKLGLLKYETRVLTVAHAAKRFIPKRKRRPT